MAETEKPKRLDLTKVDFFELLAHTADGMKQTLVIQLIELVGKGDPAALRLLEKALISAAPQDDKNKPIPILAGISQIKNEPQLNALQSNLGAVQNPQAI